MPFPFSLARLLAAPVAVAGALLAGAVPALAAVDSEGRSVPHTVLGSPTGHLAEPPSLMRALARPFSPEDDGPDALARLGSPASPEDELEEALVALRGARDADAAAAARTRALAVLEGAPLPGRSYSGIPLLNWNAPAKVRTVPAGTRSVTVRQVRFGQHLVSDTWALRFEAPDEPFTIRYEVTELGTAAGGELAPTPLLHDAGRPIGGLHSVLAPLGHAELDTGTRASSRFHPAGAAEHTRLGTGAFTVRMPPPRHVHALLDPSRRPGREALATLVPATPERVTRAERAFGFSGADPTPAERDAAIALISDRAPEKQLWSALRALDAGTDGFREVAAQVGRQGRELVSHMRTRTALPPGESPDPAAHAAVVVQNGEAYVSRRAVRLAPGDLLRVEVVNHDAITRDVEAIDLHGRRPVLGALDWGEFDWRALPLGAEGRLGPGERRVLALRPSADAFALWLGDPDHGDQAGAVLELERGPRRQSLSFSPSTSFPLHQAEDPEGRLWLTVQGVDRIGRLTPAQDLDASAYEEYLIPGGAHALGSTNPPKAPQDVAVDPSGRVWSTLVLGNAIARLDPVKARAGTAAGVTLYPLGSCEEPGVECPVAFPPEPGAEPSRQPLQLEVMEDADGNTVIWYTESGVDRIGALRVAPDGRALDQASFPCGCSMPLGIDLDPDGSVWFTEGDSNAIGRLRPDARRPFAASSAALEHFPIPSAVAVQDPLHPEPVMTSAPHSLKLDPRGRVWFTEAETAKLGMLDPAAARAGTSAGVREWDLPSTDFGSKASPADLTVDRAGTVYWVDEYGDVVGALTESEGHVRSWRPAARRSLTDSPMVDSRGDLWFLEAGANLLTRISGVTAGAPAPAPPPVYEARHGADTLSGSRVREADAFDVAVVRGGEVVARAGNVPVTGGAFRVEARDWVGPAADPLRSGDRVRIVPLGRFPRAALSFDVTSSGASATAAGVFRSAEGARPADQAPPLAPAPAAEAPPETPAAPAGPSAAPAPRTRPAWCARRLWVTGSGRSARAQVLGLSRPALEACLGRATSASGGRLRFGRALEARLAGGRVTSFTLRDASFRSERGGFRVGSPLRDLRRALPAASRDGRRALLRDGRGFAEVRVSGKGAAREITVSLRAAGRLDRVARGLARRLG